jgi:hypothetical protein
MVSGFTRLLVSEGIERHVVDAASIAVSRRLRRAKTDRIDGEALLRTLLAYKRGEPRVCAMVRVPTPEEEDRRRICRERKTLTAERVEHVNRIKGLLFSQGVVYETLHRDRRKRLEDLKTGDGRPLPRCLKAQISRGLDRLELLLNQIAAVEAERDALLAGTKNDALSPATMLLALKGLGPGIHDDALVGRIFPAFRQPEADCGLCRFGANSMAKWFGGERARGFQGWKFPLANDYDPTRLAMAAPSTRFGAEPMVPRAGCTQWRPLSQNGDHSTRTEIVGCLLEVYNRWRRHRRRHSENRLKSLRLLSLFNFRNLPRPDQSWRIQVDEPLTNMA